jgi:hypothetical protein
VLLVLSRLCSNVISFAYLSVHRPPIGGGMPWFFRVAAGLGVDHMNPWDVEDIWLPPVSVEAVATAR